ncbi:mechanosensitive ion channel family protein [Pedobacter cryoconitis]|uniref:Mechanosensitive ion channel-like protein n=1 Tax=Pedobacter cryoconitis TaxID=188932 RepID=A0A327T659_9SPHI|nr:mechanosensitive ion channel domain-containing protein [Pedobacter cryoconitis]RAJ37060.1 mechanosensitive ion channel-like protein [Pedobacter cryoconitis]
MIEEKQRSTKREFLMIIIKTIVLFVLAYFETYQPVMFTDFPFIALTAHAFMVFLGPSVAVSFLRLVVIYWYIKKHRFKSTIKDNFILGINRIVSILNTVFGVIAIMIWMGIKPLEFLTSITIVAAAIAVTFKDYITNMINGLIIMFSDRLSLGDHIRVNDNEGKILDITLINMILQNEDNDMVIIPNSVVFSSVIINQSKQNIKKLSVEFEMALNFGYTPDFLEKHLYQALDSFKDNIVSSGLTIKTLAINKDIARFKAQVLLNNYDKLKEREIRRVLNTAILKLTVPQQQLPGKA